MCEVKKNGDFLSKKAQTDGFFVDLRSWEIIRVTEHYYEVQKNPKKYRMTKKEITKDRDETLSRVLSKDFARIRGGFNAYFWSVEVNGSWADCYAAALRFAKSFSLAEYTRFLLGNLADLQHSPEELSYTELLERIESGRYGNRNSKVAVKVEVKLNRLHNMRSFTKRVDWAEVEARLQSVRPKIIALMIKK